MLTIRPATIADIPAIARIDVETWRTTYAGILPDRYLAGLKQNRREAAWGRFVARRPGDLLIAASAKSEVVGYGSCGLQHEPDFDFVGEVFTLYVAPDWQGQGAGRLLLMALFQRLIRCGLYSGLIWVLADNPSRFFYERLGGEMVARDRIVFAGEQVDAIAYAWRDLAQTINKGAKRIWCN